MNLCAIMMCILCVSMYLYMYLVNCVCMYLYPYFVACLKQCGNHGDNPCVARVKSALRAGYWPVSETCRLILKMYLFVFALFLDKQV